MDKSAFVGIYGVQEEDCEIAVESKTEEDCLRRLACPDGRLIDRGLGYIPRNSHLPYGPGYSPHLA